MSFKRKLMRRNQAHIPHCCGSKMDKKHFEDGQYAYVCQICGKTKHKEMKANGNL